MKKARRADKLFYVAIGDSLTKGTGSFIKPSFVKVYADMAEAALNKKVFTMIFAENGADTEDILAKMDYQVVKFAIKNAQIITISAGGNDFRQAAQQFFKSGDIDVLQRTLSVYEHNIRTILKRIHKLKEGQSSYFIRLLNIYNPYIDYPLADQWLDRVNASLNKMQTKRIKVANIYPIFKGRESELFAIDRLHPNGEGYALIAQAIDKLGYFPLRRK